VKPEAIEDFVDIMFDSASEGMASIETF